MNNHNILIKRTPGILLAIAVSIAACTFAAAQQNRTVVFPSRSITVSEAFVAIERQTSYLISLSHTEFDMSRRVNFSASELTLDAAMEQMLAETLRTYTIRGGHILIIRVPETADEQPAQTTAKFVKAGSTAPSAVVPAASAVVPNPDPDSADGNPPQEIEILTVSETVPQIDPAEAARLRRELARSSVLTGSVAKPMRFALKTNLLYGAVALAPNLAFEAGLGRRSTIDVAGGWNPWNMDGTETRNRKLGHWIIQPEYRWWLCERFNGHYFGAHVFGGMFNISERRIPLLFGESNSQDYRYEGWFAGAGVSYGYQLMLGRSWNLEFSIGVGYARLFYDRYEHGRCGELIQPDAGRNYFGPTKAGITLTYLIK